MRSTKTPGQNTSAGWNPSRRDVAKGLAAGLATASLGLTVAPAPAFAATTIKLGDISVTSVSDGHLQLPPSMLASNAEEDALMNAMKQAGYGGKGTYKSPVNVTVIQSGDELIMVDVGAGPNFMSTAGQLMDALDTAGIDPEAVTKVVFTHAHPDHIWGTVNDFDELNFPNATYHMSEAEHAFWMADDVLTKLPAERHGFAVGAQRNIKAIGDRLAMIKPGSDVITGVRVVDTGGHTPGHVSLEVGNGNDTAMVLGDAMNHPVISFQHPDWTPAVDQEKDRAVATRKRLLKQLAANKSRIIGYHLPSPGIGRVVAQGTGYAFQAA